MKGTVVSSWMISCRHLYGDRVVDAALEKYGFDRNYVFSPLEDVPDTAARGMIDFIGAEMGVDKAQIWGKMGEENIVTFSRNYSGFFRQENAYRFLKSMNDVHEIVMKRFKGATPPILDMEIISPREAMFIYRSKRGMGDYLAGLLRGVAKHFKEDIKVEKISASDSEIRLKLTFPSEITFKKKYRLNTLLSFGIIKNSGVKSAILTALLTAVPLFSLGGFSWQTGVIAGCVPLIAALSNALLARPLKILMNEMSDLSQRKYSAKLDIRTEDEYEDMMRYMAALKYTIQKDFIEFNSTADEMSTFNHSLAHISDVMEGTSDSIKNSIEHLAGSTHTQAQNTEHLVEVLNKSIQNIADISAESQTNNDKITTAMHRIESSFVEVESTANQIVGVMEQFKEIKNSGNQLQSNAQSITEIVSIVSGIASQINLLALNASIEASRAGDAGRGFGVVADEVRKLSVETNLAVERINSGLGGFVSDLERLVSGIDSQYAVLDQGSVSLENAVSTSAQSKDNLKEVSSLMIATSEHLKAEAGRISSLFDPIQNLAALGEENSASTQEASQSVSDYVEQITELSGKISVFQNLIQDFQSKLQEYKI
ncbi:MAG: heme NO-binding domain-containing protein [Bacillota bacterium]|nr:heme NO-binding domain-containing protein [Bacillota bacterium]